MEYLESSRRLTTTLPAGRGKVLPEEGVVEVTAAMEVEQRCDRCSLGEVAFALGFRNSLQCGIEAGDISLVMLLVVKLHDLAGDVRL